MTDASSLLPGLDETFVEHRGIRMRVFTGGDGPPLLLIHGYGGAAWNFSELAPLLPGRRLLIPDLPGHAGSGPLPASPTMAAYADAVAACLPEEPVDVFGHSLGGAVALRLAERRPDRVRRMVLAAAAGITSATRLSELTITLIGLIQPARIAGRRVDRIARSPRLRRLVFGGFEVSTRRCSPSGRCTACCAARRCTPMRWERVARCRPTTPAETSTGFAARCSSSGAAVTGRCRSRTASSMRAVCVRPCA